MPTHVSAARDGYWEERKVFQLMDDRFGYYHGMHHSFPWCLVAMVVAIALLVAGVILLVRYVALRK